ncbi:MAG: PQQ-binding-like beta-propeller repeat protein, partial [Planctomycetia bacterium]
VYRFLAAASLLAAAACRVAQSGDWPQILGPDRNGIAAADEVLADDWPTEGPPTLWLRDVGSGYAGVAVADRRTVLFHRVKDKEVTEALDAINGKTLWTDEYETKFKPDVGGGDGPLCVPVIHGNRVITFGAAGMLTCLDAATGKRLWQRNTHADFNAQPGYFGAGSSPIVMGKLVIVNVGGAKNEAGIVGFSLATGETVWTKTAERASYSSPVPVMIADVPHLLVITRYRVILLDPATGAVRWQFAFGARGPTVNAANPLVLADKNGKPHLLVTSSYGVGSIYGAFNKSGMNKVWGGTESLATQYCTPIARGGFLFCIDGRDDVPPADLKCIQQATGEVIWKEANFGYGSLLFADGKILATKADGELVLIKPDTAGLQVLARARPFPGTVRALPALSNGRLYVRDEHTLKCLSVKPRAR